jgi:hypothetical protein
MSKAYDASVVNTNVPTQGLRCRQIGETDIPAIATLLARGFQKRNRKFWLRGLEQLKQRNPPPSLPKYGYLMESGDRPVGALLLICSTMRDKDAITTRCNLSSWYVEPKFRTYATLLVSQALERKDVTYLNVSAARYTWPIIEAQGFSRYCDGVFLAVPILSGLFGQRVNVLDGHERPEVAFDNFEQEILLQHAGFGCMSLWCVTSDRAYPFVFRPRMIKAVIPSVQLVYCRDLGDFVRFAGPIGRFLALRGRLFVLVDSNGRVPGLVGKFFRDKMPKYFKGPQRPRLGDLAYTEIAVLGV